METTTLAAIVLAWMTHLSPPSAAPPDPDVAETAEQRAERYRDIADDIAAAAALDAEPRRAAATLTAVSFMESGWAPGVDQAVCGATRARRGGCDHGRAVSIFQLRGIHTSTRAEAAVVALARVHQSERACRALPPELQLAAYASGTCSRGWAAARARHALAQRLLGVQSGTWMTSPMPSPPSDAPGAASSSRSETAKTPPDARAASVD